MRQRSEYIGPVVKGRWWRAIVTTVASLVGLLAVCALVVAQPGPSPRGRVEESLRDVRSSAFQQRAESYRQLVYQRPEATGAFDRWYRLYVDANAVEGLRQSTRVHAEAHRDDKAAQIVWGLVCERGNDHELTVRVWQQASDASHETNDYFARWHLATAYQRLARWEEASIELSKAYRAKQVPLQDLRTMSTQLAALHQRLGHSSEAISLWKEESQRAARDAKGLQQCALQLQELGAYREAYDVWKQLEQLHARDATKSFNASQEAARCLTQSGALEAARVAWIELLDRVDAQSGRGTALREELNRALQAQGGIGERVKFWQDRLAKGWSVPIARRELAMASTLQGHDTEALKLYEAALVADPHEVASRQALVQLLTRHGRFDEAIERLHPLTQDRQYARDALLELGQLQLWQALTSGKSDVAAALATWSDVLTQFPNDRDLARAIAERCHVAATEGLAEGESTRPREVFAPDLRERHASLWERELSLWIHLTKLDPTSDARWKHAELLHRLDRRDEALRVWFAEPSPNTAFDWRQAAESLARCGYRDESWQAARRAIDLAPHDIEHWTYLIDQYLAEQQWEAARERLAAMRTLQPDDDEWMFAVLDRDVRCLVGSQSDAEGWDELSQIVTQTPDNHWAQWELVLLAQGTNQLERVDNLMATLATHASSKPVQQRRLAELWKARGVLDRAGSIYEELVAKRGPALKENYRQVIQLYLERDDLPQARRWATAMVRELPRDRDARWLLISVAERMADDSLLLTSLQEAIESRPRDAEFLRRLATYWHERGMLAESLSAIGTALKVTDSLEEQLALVRTALTWTNDRAQRLSLLTIVDRSMSERDENTTAQRACRAEILQAIGDDTGVLEQLQAIVQDEPFEVNWLQRLVAAANDAQRWDVAARYQQQLVYLAGTPENRERLARYYRQSGDPEKAAALWETLVQTESTEQAALDVVEQLLQNSEWLSASRLLEAHLARHPQSWRLAHWAALVHLALDDLPAARADWRFVLQARSSAAVHDPPLAFAWAVATDRQVVTARERAHQYGARRATTQSVFLHEAFIEAAREVEPLRAQLVASIGWLRTASDEPTYDDIARSASSPDVSLSTLRAAALAHWIVGDARTADQLGQQLAAREPAEPTLAMIRVLQFGNAAGLSNLRVEEVRTAFHQLKSVSPDFHRVFRPVYARQLGRRAVDDRDRALVREEITAIDSLDTLADWVAILSRLDTSAHDEVLRALQQRALAIRDASPPASAPQLPDRDSLGRIIDCLLDAADPQSPLWQRAVLGLLADLGTARDKPQDSGPGTGSAGVLLRDLSQYVVMRQSLGGSARRSDSDLGVVSALVDPRAITRSLADLLFDGEVANRRSPREPQGNERNDDRESTFGFPSPAMGWDRAGLERIERAAFELSSLNAVQRSTLVDELADDGISENDRSAAFLRVCLHAFWHDGDRAQQQLERLLQNQYTDRPLAVNLVRCHLWRRQYEEAAQVLRAIKTESSTDNEWNELQKLLRDAWTEQAKWHELSGHEGAVTAICSSPAGDELASVGVDGTVRLWNVARGELVRMVGRHEDMVMAVAWSPRGNELASAGYDHVVRRWNLADGTALAPLVELESTVRALCYSPDGNLLAAAGDDHRVVVWDRGSGKMTHSWQLPQGAIHALAFSSDGQRLAAVGGEQLLAVWSLPDGEAPLLAKVEIDTLRALAYVDSPEPSWMTGGDGSEVEWWQPEVSTSAQGRVASRPVVGPLRAIAYAPRRQAFALAHGDHLVSVWDTSSDHELMVLRDQGRVLALAMPVDGTWVASAGFDPIIKLWRIPRRTDAPSPPAGQ